MYHKNSVYESRGGGSVHICHISVDSIENTFFKRENTSIFNHFRAAMPVSFHTQTHTHTNKNLPGCLFHPQPPKLYLSISVSFFIRAYVSKHTTYVCTRVISAHKSFQMHEPSVHVFSNTAPDLFQSPSLTVSLRSLTGPYSHPDRNVSPSSNHFKVCL